MNPLRRTALRAAAAVAAGLLFPLRALAAWNKDAFGAKTGADALKSLGAAASTESRDIVIDAPQIAENGSVVPIEITSNLPNTKSITLVIEKNPFPLAAKFDFGEGAVPYVKVNVKMGESSFVRVVAEAGGRHYSATKEVKVTIGGCGG
ncbi:MAG: thiosulfate oxidation carrier protein SoxY [Candidatus Parcubacteria bacterium]|nr:thiosulfate oxidation carrier protein SoxY [Burkholderiales bacterium]